MMESEYVTRYRNLKALSKNYPTLAAFAKRLNRHANLISRLLLDDPDKRKNIGPDLAKAIEVELGLERYSLSHPFVNPNDIVDTLKVAYVKYLAYEQPTGDAVMYEDNKRCPINSELLDAASVLPGDAALFIVKDDSMLPDLQPDESVLINVKAKSIINGYMYAIKLDAKLLIRRLFSNPNGTIKVVCDNTYKKAMLPDVVIEPNEVGERFVMVGKVFSINKLIR